MIEMIQFYSMMANGVQPYGAQKVESRTAVAGADVGTQSDSNSRGGFDSPNRQPPTQTPNQFSADGDVYQPSVRSPAKSPLAAAAEGSKSPEDLSPEEKDVVEKLKARDREVRTHEQAHISAGGPYVRGGASYTYQQGPDKRSYAIGGEVSIDASSTGEPAKDVEKARVVQAAALAPAEPSPQDLKVAAEAQQMGAQASAELAKGNSNPNGVEDGANPASVQGNLTRQALDPRIAAYGGPVQNVGQRLNFLA